jgi:hypothetical protein
LINEGREVLSIVALQIGNGPFNLVLEDDISFSDHLNLESPISISPAQLTLGGLTIYTADVKSWNPHPDWGMLHQKRDEILDQITQLSVINYLKHAGFDTTLDEHSGLLDHRGFPIVQSLLSSLSAALANADISFAKTITSRLSGLGQGLTPAGDDVIMGAIYAAWIIHPVEIAGVLVEEIANTAAPLTTSLSAAWLRAAGRGKAGILWHEFFDALISATAIRVQESIENILAIGETSGADALAGFFGTMLASMENTSTGPPE